MKRIATITLALCLLGFVAVAQDPPDPPPQPEDAIQTTVNVTFSNPNANEARAATWKLAQVNQVRTDHGLAEHANVAEMCEVIIKRQVVSWLAQEAEAREQDQDVKVLWKAATNAQRTAAIAALQN